MTNHSPNQFGECFEKHFGLYPGVAEDVIDPKGKGRITVRLPWISKTYVTRLAHVAQLYAGNGYGAVWIPEHGDQVIVAFLKGQLSNPVVLGSIFNNRHKPSASRTKTEDPKIFRTKAGHHLLMEDKKGKRIELTDLTGKNSVVIDTEKNTINVKAEKDVKVTAKGNIELDATKDIKISAGGNVSISATGNVDVSGAVINLN